jgi:hypothetical protein
MNASTMTNPTCQFPACLDGSCERDCIRQERREFAQAPRAKLRKLAKEAAEQVRRLENEMDA